MSSSKWLRDAQQIVCAEQTQTPDGAKAAPLVSAVMPCLNEEQTLAKCIQKAQHCFKSLGISGEVVVADNGSTDKSVEIALVLGARIVHQSVRGYGAALMQGIEAARGQFVVIADADDSYDWSGMGPYIERLQAGADLVVGNRFRGGIGPGAMPPLHRYFGNPVLSWIARALHGAPIGDFHCGMRALRRSAWTSMRTHTPGMEFATEMILNSVNARLRVCEVPTTLVKDGRDRPPHLRSWRDGWRHLRLMLMLSPRWLMLYPGLCLIALGSAAELAILRGPIIVHGVGFDIHTMLYAAGATVLGVQLTLFSLLARTVGVLKKLLPMTRRLEMFLRVFTLDRGILLGSALCFAGFWLAVHSVTSWAHAHLSALNPTTMMRVAIPSVTLMITGAEIVFASFLLEFIGVRATSGQVE